MLKYLKILYFLLDNFFSIEEKKNIACRIRGRNFIYSFFYLGASIDRCRDRLIDDKLIKEALSQVF